jgi:hypothetical protein
MRIPVGLNQFSGASESRFRRCEFCQGRDEMMLPGNDLSHGISVIHGHRNADSFLNGIAIHLNGMRNPIIATRTSLFTGPHRLAVQHRAAGLALSSSRLPHPLAHGVMDLRPDSLPGATTKSNDRPYAKEADRAAAVSKRHRCELRNRSHS